MKSIQYLRHQDSANFVLLVSLLLTLNIFTPCSSFSILTMNRRMPGGICCIHFHIYRSSHPQAFFKERCSTNDLDSLQENIHAKSWLQLYWNHTSGWVFFCKYATYLQQNALFREHFWSTASVYCPKYRGYKCSGSL